MKDLQTPKQKKTPSLLSKLESIHPHQMIFNLAVASIFIAFTFLVISLAAARLERLGVNIDIPIGFYISFGILNLTSWAIACFNLYFRNSDFEKSIAFGYASIGLVLAFIVFQSWGAWQISSVHHLLTDEKTIKGYIYVLTALHFLHVIAGLAALIYRMVWLKNQMNDSVKLLVIETNPYQKLMTSLLTQYWHFMTLLWWLIFIYFLK